MNTLADRIRGRAYGEVVLRRIARRRFAGFPEGYRLIVDLFAGGGGASLGIEQALGRSPDIAINHDAEAVAMHAANHPDTWHLTTDVWEVVPASVTAGRPVGLLWASPDCKHFSKAKGGQPVKKRVRSLAWVVVKWAQEVRPDVIILENVEEFATWGPLVQKVDALGAPLFDLHGSPVMVPCKKRKGETFHRWRRSIEKLGYHGEFRERRAYGSGAGTIRKRLYYIFTRVARAIVWPAATHGDPKKTSGLLPWVTAADCIDWSLPCPSIFDTADEIKRALGIRAQRPLKEKTLARIAKGMWRYVINARSPFIVPITHGGGLSRSYPAATPLNTVTGARRGELALVQPFVAGVGGRMGQTEARSVSNPMQTHTAKPDAVVVTPFVTKFRNGATGAPMTEPVATITAHQSQVHPAGAAPLGVVAPVLVRTAHGDVDAGGHRRGRGEHDVGEPLASVLASNDTAAVSAFMVPRYGEREGQEPRTRAVDEPMPVVVPTGNGASVVAAHMMTMRNADKPHDAVDRPAHTFTAEGARPHVVAAFLAKHFGDVGQRPGSEGSEPVGTVTAQDHNALVQAELLASGGIVNLKGSDRRQSEVTDPVPALTAQGRHVAEVRAFLMKYHATGGQHADLRDPMPTVDCNDRVGIVTVAGVDYQIVDIGMRMLTPRERFRAQGFPDSYIIDLTVEKTKRGKVVRAPLSAEAQGRMVGNSVCPTEARALVAANAGHLAVALMAAPGEQRIPTGGQPTSTGRPA
jgi:DNA (cytosine-5)-methyltransferase 1